MPTKEMTAYQFIESFGSKTFERAHNEMSLLSLKQLSDVFTHAKTKDSIFTVALAIAYLSKDAKDLILKQIDPIFNNQNVKNKFLQNMSIVDALAWYAVIDKKMHNSRKLYRSFFAQSYTDRSTLTHEQFVGMISHIKSLPLIYGQIKEQYPNNFVKDGYRIVLDGIVIEVPHHPFNVLRPFIKEDLDKLNDILHNYNNNLYIKKFSDNLNVQKNQKNCTGHQGYAWYDGSTDFNRSVRISKEQLFCLSRDEINMLHNINIHHHLISLVDKTQQNIEWNKKYLICFVELIQKEHLIIDHDADFVLFVSCRYRFLPKIFSRVIFSWISYILTRNYFIFSSFISELVVSFLLDYLFKPKFCPSIADFYWSLRYSLFFLFNIMDCFCHDAWLYTKFIFLTIVSFYFIPYDEKYEHSTREGGLLFNGFRCKTYGNHPPDHQISLCWKKIPDLLRSNIVEVY